MRSTFSVFTHAYSAVALQTGHILSKIIDVQIRSTAPPSERSCMYCCSDCVGSRQERKRRGEIDEDDMQAQVVIERNQRSRPGLCLQTGLGLV